MTRQPKIERKTEYLPVYGEVKATNDQQGITEGYLNHKNNIDYGKDRTLDGAFRKSLADSYSRKSAQGLDYLWPYLWNHDYSVLPVGGIFEAEEDTKGLFIKTQYNMDIQAGRELYASFKNGFMKKQSMGYKAYQHEYVKDKAAGTVRNLIEVGIIEGSAVVFAMNDLASVTMSKNLQSKDFSENLQHAMQHDWFEDLAMAWQSLVQEIINGFMVGDTPVEDVRAALTPFNAAILDYVQRGVDLDISTFLNGPIDTGGGDMDGGYMSLILARDTKAGRMISNANHQQLSKACDGISQHVGNIQKVLKTAAQSSDAADKALQMNANNEEREQIDAASLDAQLEQLFMDVSLNNALKNLRG